MQIIPLPRDIQDVVYSNENLMRYLEGLNRTQAPTQRSWLYEREQPDTILDNWMHQLERLKHGNSFELEVFQFDTSQLEKWGPQGGHPPISKVMETVILPTFRNHSPEPGLDSALWDKALCEVIEKVQPLDMSTLRPASYKRVIDDMRARDTLESNSGFPLFERRSLPNVKEQAVWAATNGLWKTYPAIALFRNYNQKLRLVWMFPMSTNLVEASYTQPLQSRLIKQRHHFLAPWEGFDAVRDLITDCYNSGKFIAASDFSATDEHFRLRATAQVHDVIAAAFQRGRPKFLQSKGSFKAESANLRETLINMHNIPLLISPEEMVVGEHGVSSGSNWTNFIETIFDWIFSHYVRWNTTYRGLCAIGDDMAWVADRYDEEFAAQLQGLGKLVGQEINAEKTNNYRDKVKFLQRLFQRGYRRPDGKLRGVYSTIRALKSSVFPEKFHKPKDWSSDMFCARQYMILENCVDHPLFKEFVYFVVNGQRDLIPFARKSADELTRIHREARIIPGLNPTYNQEKRDQSLATFESIRIARMY